VFHSLSRFIIILWTSVIVFNCGSSADSKRPSLIELDATQSPVGLLRAHIVLPATPGPFIIAYPKWIPGEHAPTGPINNIVRMTFKAGGHEIEWRRDDVDMYIFHVNVPEGTDNVDATLEFAWPMSGEGFSAAGSTQEMLTLHWNQVVLYSPSLPNDQNVFVAKLRLPTGWRFASALPVAAQHGSEVDFAPVSLTTLVDSPLLAGGHFVSFPLGGQNPTEMDIASDREEALVISSAQKHEFEQLVAEANILFGGARYQHYNLLLTLSDNIDHYTLEHYESSDNRLPQRGLTDPTVFLTSASLIPHEYVHSWNGKYRPPAGLDISTFQDPIKGNLLWVYEGLTDYISNILTARAGFWTPEQYRQSLALDAAEMAMHTGRTWRPLQDTTIAVQLLYFAPTAWSAERRGDDFYPESGLIWLEADSIIRQKTRGKRSLDDFCRRFFGAENGPAPKPYQFEDVVAAMNQVAEYDWKHFFLNRLNATTPQPPLQGIEDSGWTLVYTEDQPEIIAGLEASHKIDLLWPAWEKYSLAEARFSIGLLLAEDGTVLDSIPGKPAYNSGITPGMQIVSVNGLKFTPGVLHSEIRKTKNRGGLELLVSNGGFRKTCRLDYHDGEKYPSLRRNESKPDLLGDILAARTH
jgi:predicted metalloprotease with PDZ domain